MQKVCKRQIAPRAGGLLILAALHTAAYSAAAQAPGAAPSWPSANPAPAGMAFSPSMGFQKMKGKSQGPG
ncbi:hypothetical protein BVG81_005620 [Haliangium sp. UPWRP_2]|nr:hypothetical protein BVG81_005620 [Haliangium sp. UPWRP_2]